MSRRIKQSRSLLAPLTSNFIKRLSNTDKRLRRKVIRYGFWAIGLLFCYSLMSGTYGLPRIIRLEMRKQALIDANRQQLIELVDADRIRRMLKNSPQYIESIARTRYHMVYPGEIIFRYGGR